MFDKLLEKIKRVDEMESKLLSIFEGKSWERIAIALYQVLDDISTADDMCKEDTEAFRNIVMRLQAKKNQFLFSPDGYSLKKVSEWKEPSQEQLDKISQEMFGKDYDKLPVIMQATVKDKAITKSKNENHSVGDKHNATTLLEGVVSCSACGQDMNEVDTCGASYMQIGPNYYKRDSSYFDVNERCHDCNILNEEGNTHHLNCDIERCPRCGKQNIGCPCNEFGKKYLKELPEEVAVRESKIDENKLDNISQEMFGKDYEDLPDYDHQQAVRDVAKLSRAKGTTYTAKDVFAPGVTPPEGFGRRESKLKENLTDFARKELELVGLFDKDSDYDGMLGEAVMELIQKFGGQGHSGMSAAMVRELFAKLSNYKPLSELTDNIDEWQLVTDNCSHTPGKPLHQSRRSPSAFSNDEGKTYWDIDEEYYIHEDEDGSRWSGGLSEEEWDNRPVHQSKHIGKEE